ncbi:uncharacterized protein LOC142337294 [Convolutriloba macropyga]|uniref:uncharacterized protein LOC142337294 n=1 Tax=Convolutriloba macropyga TaxID=536237 RepID=UPI003F51F669
MSSDSRLARLKKISLGAKIAGAFEKQQTEDHDTRDGGSTARSSTFSSRGLYTMPDDYESDPEPPPSARRAKKRIQGLAEEEEEMISVSTGQGLQSAPPPPQQPTGTQMSSLVPRDKNSAYIGDGKYVDTSMDASLMAEEAIRAQSGKGSKLYAEAPDNILKRPIASKIPPMKFSQAELNQPSFQSRQFPPTPDHSLPNTRHPAGYLQKLPPWRAPGSWSAHPGGYPPSAPWSHLPSGGDNVNSGKSSLQPGAFGLQPGGGKFPGDFNDNSLSFGAFWNLNPRNVDEFASQMDNMFRSIGSGVDQTNDHINTKINRADLRFDELESDSRAAMYDNSIAPYVGSQGIFPSPRYPKAEVPFVRVPLRPASVTRRFNVYAK